jgi:hypothetical protein
MEGKELLGLFGAVVVDRANGPIDRYVEANGNAIPVTQSDITKQFVLFMVGSTFWGTEIASDGTQKPLWANPHPGAVENDIVRFHILSVGPGHTFHLHAHRWFKTGTNEVIDTKLLTEGFDTHSFTVKAGTGVGAGNWQYHCHLIAHMEAGMHGSFIVDPVGGDGTGIVGASPYGNILPSLGYRLILKPNPWKLFIQAAVSTSSCPIPMACIPLARYCGRLTRNICLSIKPALIAAADLSPCIHPGCMYLPVKCILSCLLQ